MTSDFAFIDGIVGKRLLFHLSKPHMSVLFGRIYVYVYLDIARKHNLIRETNYSKKRSSFFALVFLYSHFQLNEQMFTAHYLYLLLTKL